MIRRLYDLGWQEQDIRNLYRFIDWVMILPKALEAEFWEQFKQFEQERTMRYVTTGERIGYERGKQEGEQTLILRQLQRRVGELSPEVRRRVSEAVATKERQRLVEDIACSSSFFDSVRGTWRSFIRFYNR